MLPILFCVTADFGFESVFARSCMGARYLQKGTKFQFQGSNNSNDFMVTIANNNVVYTLNLLIV